MNSPSGWVSKHASVQLRASLPLTVLWGGVQELNPLDLDTIDEAELLHAGRRGGQVGIADRSLERDLRTRVDREDLDDLALGRAVDGTRPRGRALEPQRVVHRQARRDE